MTHRGVAIELQCESDPQSRDAISNGYVSDSIMSRHVASNADAFSTTQYSYTTYLLLIIALSLIGLEGVEVKEGQPSSSFTSSLVYLLLSLCAIFFPSSSIYSALSEYLDPLKIKKTADKKLNNPNKHNKNNETETLLSRLLLLFLFKFFICGTQKKERRWGEREGKHGKGREKERKEGDPSPSSPPHF